MSSDINRARMPPSLPPVPVRRSSLEPGQAQPPKKRMSLTTIPILSKLGLGKTSSAPAVPTNASKPTATNPQRVSTQPATPSTLPQTVVASDARDLGDDAKTEVDEEEQLMIDEPESFDFKPSVNAEPEPSKTAVKTKLTLDIPTHEPKEGEKEILREVDSNSARGSRSHTPKSASVGTGIWLCSKPQASTPSSPIDENGKRRRSVVGRPLVIRAMSTGRLASEFDEEGRVICLSNHCERVLKGRPVPSALSSPLEEGDELKRTFSATNPITPPKMGIARSQTSSNVTSPIPRRRMSVEAGFRRLESFGGWSKRAVGAGDLSM